MNTQNDLLDTLLSRTRDAVADQQLTLRELSARTGIPYGTLSHLWYGTVRDPRWSVVSRLMAFVDASLPPQRRRREKVH